MSESDFQMYTPMEYQNILANHVIKNNTFKFNSRQVPNIKKGTMYCFKSFNDHTYNAVFVESFNFFKKGFNATMQPDKTTQLSLRGYGNIKSKAIVNILREKIRKALMDVTSKDHFTENCDLVLRFSGISTCSGMQGQKNKHGVCISAKAVFEKLKNVQIVANNNDESITCLFKNIVHSHKEFEKLKIVFSSEDEKFTITNFDVETKGKVNAKPEDLKKFVHNVMPSDCVDENIYSSHTKNLSGLMCLSLTGVYLNDDTAKQDTMTLWCKICNCHLVTDTYDISDSITFGLSDNEDILKYRENLEEEEKEEGDEEENNDENENTE